MKSTSAKCGHIKRRLSRGERLTGKTLEFALEVLATGCGESKGEIAEKLEAGIQLTEYELHLMLDVYLLHARFTGEPINADTPVEMVLKDGRTIPLRFSSKASREDGGI